MRVSAENGENIHSNTVQLSPQLAVDAWMENGSECLHTIWSRSTDLQNTTMDNSKVRTDRPVMADSGSSQTDLTSHYTQMVWKVSLLLM
jgi:hypothetical protein